MSGDDLKKVGMDLKDEDGVEHDYGLMQVMMMSVHVQFGDEGEKDEWVDDGMMKCDLIEVDVPSLHFDCSSVDSMPSSVVAVVDSFQSFFLLPSFLIQFIPC